MPDIKKERDSRRKKTALLPNDVPAHPTKGASLSGVSFLVDDWQAVKRNMAAPFALQFR